MAAHTVQVLVSNDRLKCSSGKSELFVRNTMPAEDKKELQIKVNNEIVQL